MSPATWLRSKADSYARDAALFRHSGDDADADLYYSIAEELRRCATYYEQEVRHDPRADG